MKKLDRLTRNFNIVCLGVMAIGMVIFAVGSLIR